jgi:hypothetical protein
VNSVTDASPIREAIWRNRLFPGLTLTASPARFDNDRAHQVTFRVRDAGHPVDVTVRVAGRALATGADGNVTTTFARGFTTTFARGFRTGRYKPTASGPGYTSDSVTIRVT